MTLEKLSAVAELVSSIAIVLTLGYLAIQTQQNTTAIQATVRQAMLADDLAIIRQQLDFPNATVARYGGSELTDEALIELNSTLLSLVRVRENQWLQYQNGVIDEQTWRTYQTALTAVFATEFTRSWFRNRSERGEFDQGFVDSVNELFADHPVGPTHSIRETLGFDPQ
jgi:glucose/arabinose dehydrogenase